MIEEEEAKAEEKIRSSSPLETLEEPEEAKNYEESQTSPTIVEDAN